MITVQYVHIHLILTFIYIVHVSGYTTVMQVIQCSVACKLTQGWLASKCKKKWYSTVYKCLGFTSLSLSFMLSLHPNADAFVQLHLCECVIVNQEPVGASCLCSISLLYLKMKCTFKMHILYSAIQLGVLCGNKWNVGQISMRHISNIYGK